MHGRAGASEHTVAAVLASVAVLHVAAVCIAVFVGTHDERLGRFRPLKQFCWAWCWQ